MSKRQVVFIMTDTQGANCVGCYDPRAVGTPVLDRFAGQGMRFDRAYTTCPVCSPARGAIFTGLFPHSNGVWGNDMALGRDARTLGERLTDQGLHAAYIGKWHLSATDYFDTGLCPPGWDERYWFDGRNHLATLSEEMRAWSRQYHTPEEIRAADYTREKTFAGGVTDRAVDFLNACSDEDFCLVVSYDEPHHPSIAPAPFCDMHQEYRFEIGPAASDDLSDKPDHHRQWAENNRRGEQKSFRDGRYYVVQPYFACNSFVDDEIGRVLAAIDDVAPDAMVIYTSDHGEMMWAHQLNSKGPVMYEPITRIPFMVRRPGQVEAGSVCDEPVSQIDIMPTILDYFGLECPPILQGRSMLGRLRGEEAGASGQGPEVFMEFNRHGITNTGFGGFKPSRCVFDGRFKLVINLLTGDELYDLQADPHELENLISSPEHSEVRDRLHQRLLAWMDETRDPFSAPEWRHRQWAQAGEIRWSDWNKGRRHRPADGYNPPALEYNTGLEAQ